MKKTNNNESLERPVSERKRRFSIRSIRSIRGKLVLLGLVAVAATAVLGAVGIYSVGSTNRNNELLATINDINLYSNENDTLNVRFLYELDNSCNEQMHTNAEKMVEMLSTALDKSGASFKKSLTSFQSNVTKTAENLRNLLDLMGKRGFRDTDGEFANFIANDEELNQLFKQMGDEDASWVDAAWKTFDLASLPRETIGGVTYAKLSHSVPLPMQSKRDIVAFRLGQNGIRYHGQVYITKISFDGKQEIDFSKLKNKDLESSWGGCYKDLNIASFNGKKAVHFTGAYNAANSDEWTESVIQIPIEQYNVQNYKYADYDLYLEVVSNMPKELNTTTCYTDKFDFEAALSNVNADFTAYSKSIAEGTAADETAQGIASTLETLTKNLSDYSVNQELIANGSSLLKKKADSFSTANEADGQIVQLKQENNSLNTKITEQAVNLQTSIKKHTDSTHRTTLVIIIIVFIISLILVAFLTVYVVISIGKSIHGFNATLQKLAQGDMTVKAQIGKGDEFDEFGSSLNHMTEKIASVLSSVNRIAADVNQSGNDLENFAKGTNENSSVIGASIRDIVTGATNQARDVEDSTLQMSKMGDLMNAIVENATDLDITSGNMQAASTDVQQILQKLSESNEHMTTGIRQISNLIIETNESVIQISDAANLISSIAEETNLLSLNASIEAARAGEVGKGFAVVATEIQQLADQTNKSADSISTVIKNLTEGFQHTIDTMEEVQNSTDEQNANLAETMRKFSIVNDGISTSRSGTRAIKESIDACNEVRNRINEILLNLSSISEEYAAATTETDDSMESLNETIHELLDASGKLSCISGELEDSMAYFQL